MGHSSMSIEILYKSKNFIVINKPKGIPSQPDLSGDANALSLAEQMLRSSGEESGLFLVHRLDRVVGGVLAFARNKKAAAEVSAILNTDLFVKEYIAVVEGHTDGGSFKDFIYKDKANSKALVCDKQRSGAKLAELSCLPIESADGKTLVKVRLTTGRFHQIRAQLSSRGNAIIGDGKYGSRDSRAHMPALFAKRIAFSALGEKIDVTALPDIREYPWSEFEIEGKV